MEGITIGIAAAFIFYKYNSDTLGGRTCQRPIYVYYMIFP